MENHFSKFFKRGGRLLLLVALTLYVGEPTYIRASEQAKTITVELKDVSAIQSNECD